ncbi:MAG: cyclic pyranopterin monophosphate synthase MoaC [Pseudomonadota bacterium]
MAREKSLTHFDEAGRPRMVDVSDKPETARVALATGTVRMSREALDLVIAGAGKKGDALATAELAGVMAAKKTADLIPLCHPLPLTGAKIESDVDEEACAVTITARIKTSGKTGVEMEALTAVSVACLTLYDMLKSVDRAMTISEIALVEKSGGASDDYLRNDGGAS